MVMSLIEIVKDVLSSSFEKLTLDQLAMLVENHSDYRGKSKGRELRNRIRRILEDEEFEQEKRGSGVYFGIKLGRFEIKTKIDLS